MRIGVMGGSFDPVHNGHLVAASEVAHRFDLDRVLFSPTGMAWRKEAAHAASAEIRYLMTVVATAADPRFDVTRVDIDRPSPTYTVDTLRDLRDHFAQDHPDDTVEWFFITGADALADILAWRDPERILEQAHLIGVTRPGHVLADPGLPEGAATLVEVPALAISSTDVRARVGRGEPIRYLVPTGVAHMIVKHGLYAAPTA
ncbi:MAG: nicotinate-nucleotide adenylyltransferase [Actinomycetes bacterium]